MAERPTKNPDSDEEEKKDSNAEKSGQTALGAAGIGVAAGATTAALATGVCTAAGLTSAGPVAGGAFAGAQAAGAVTAGSGLAGLQSFAMGGALGGPVGLAITVSLAAIASLFWWGPSNTQTEHQNPSSYQGVIQDLDRYMQELNLDQG